MSNDWYPSHGFRIRRIISIQSHVQSVTCALDLCVYASILSACAYTYVCLIFITRITWVALTSSSAVLASLAPPSPSRASHLHTREHVDQLCIHIVYDVLYYSSDYITKMMTVSFTAFLARRLDIISSMLCLSPRM